MGSQSQPLSICELQAHGGISAGLGAHRPGSAQAWERPARACPGVPSENHLSWPLGSSSAK